MPRQAAEPQLEDAGIYRKRWWARVYCTANFPVGDPDLRRLTLWLIVLTAPSRIWSANLGSIFLLSRPPDASHSR